MPIPTRRLTPEVDGDLDHHAEVHWPQLGGAEVPWPGANGYLIGILDDDEERRECRRGIRDCACQVQLAEIPNQPTNPDRTSAGLH
ncbi:MAG TPA: hypothetical protein VJT31_17130 [Rugosimonospora sp.]|nr:hypothetical protein [Rugosimonospora sp.]